MSKQKQTTNPELLLTSKSRGLHEPLTYHANDDFGERTLIAPKGEIVATTEEAATVDILLELEATTGTRLRDGGNPFQFIRLFGQWDERTKLRGGRPFDEFVRRRHSDWIEVLGDAVQGNLACPEQGDAQKTVKQNRPTNDQAITIEDAATQLRCSEKMIYRMMKDGLPYFTIRNVRRMWQSKFVEFCEKSNSMD